MAKIRAFKGIHYNINKIENFDKVITLPYDKIDKDLQTDYYNRSPYNFVRIILGKNEVEGAETKYANAKGYIETWLKENALLQENKECLYPYTQEYTVDGVRKTRVSFITVLKLHDYEDGVVIPHERTLSGPKKDRTRLLEETNANTELIFFLYQDKENSIKKSMEKALSEEPIITMTHDDGVIHRVYKIDDKEIIDYIKKEMTDKKVFIADGHHRYETSLEYSKRFKKDNEEIASDFVLCALVNMNDDSGLTILPTHRVVKNIENFSKETLLTSLNTNFNVEKCENLEKLNETLSKSSKSFGLCFENDFYLVSLKDKKIALNEITDDISDAAKLLDVSILHKLILENLLGIDKKKLEEKTNLEYIRGYKKAYDIMIEKNLQCVFLLNSTLIEELSEVASNGDKMPQKSTDFYPKLKSGLVFRKIED